MQLTDSIRHGKLINFENTLHANIGLWNDITQSLSPETNSKFERRVAPK